MDWWSCRTGYIIQLLTRPHALRGPEIDTAPDSGDSGGGVSASEYGDWISWRSRKDYGTVWMLHGNMLWYSTIWYDMIWYDMIWCYLIYIYIYKGIKEWSHAGILHMVSLVLGQQIITNLWGPQIESSLWCTFHSWAPNPSSFPIPFAGETLRRWNSPVLLPIPSDISESKWSMFPNIPIFF